MNFSEPWKQFFNYFYTTASIKIDREVIQRITYGSLRPTKFAALDIDLAYEYLECAGLTDESKKKTIVNLIRKFVFEAVWKQTGLDIIETMKVQERIVHFAKIYFKKEYNLQNDNQLNIEYTINAEYITASATIFHQNGLTQKFSIRPHHNFPKFSKRKYLLAHVDPRELIVYKWLELMGLGPQAHFILNDFDLIDTFIATEDFGASFQTYSELSKKPGFKYFYASSEHQNLVVLLNLLIKLFYLADLAPSQFGFLNNQTKILNPHLSRDPFSIDRFELFCDKDLQFWDKRRHGNFDYKEINKDVKLAIASKISHQLSVETMMKNLDTAESYVNGIFRQKNQDLTTSIDYNFFNVHRYLLRAKRNILYFNNFFELQ